MVFVKVRETYDLKTVANKMTVIAIRTPKPQILKDNFPGLLMQCKAYRPVSANVRIACASTMPLDPKGVGTTEGDVAPEDMFNPILYKSITNVGMSQLESRINMLGITPVTSGSDVNGNTAVVDVDSFTNTADEFPIYYGLLSDAHGWRHANPQAGLEMTNLQPKVFEMLYNTGDTTQGFTTSSNVAAAPDADGNKVTYQIPHIRGNAKPVPFINCTSYSATASGGYSGAGFAASAYNAETDVPEIKVICGVIIIPPSRLHELFFRMVVEWTIEFSAIRTLSEITSWTGLGGIGAATHFQNYSYSSAKLALTGSEDSILSKGSSMVESNVDIDKVM